MDVRVKRIYDDPVPDDGRRVLVDRVWPRGVSKERAALDLWCKDVAPSTELRKWYGHDPDKQKEFAARYRAELAAQPAAGALADLRATHGPLTLLTATHELGLSQAQVLADTLNG
ncbi:DUF488 family protein [Jatrophihabitans cynanchi]|uniref:DUF488 family protein n=1 Tax=Jatrophihabitans cynanchi TaxID=2944128 RepID=A0ABY7JRJ4_9ACTN|nr:DUF488 family protein [Jatrophihabitans sp. SB3-54]WAX55180.1 DUF488 family protein [Jatrophihabitans sp. SB3-54]